MENIHPEFTEKETSERRNSNTEWLLAKCRITKPPPPKPATNPLQFIKVAPCPLFQKAQEQIKKVEEIKIMRQDMSDDAEEWQQNLDNWKSSRRKRQEHIIDRVVEAKKIEQEEHDRSRRKSKTFHEMLEERNKRGKKLNILLYNDDQNDLSDYGIGRSSRNNDSKDADTDDSCSILDDKDPLSDSHDASNISNQSQSEDESINSSSIDKENNIIDTKLLQNNHSREPPTAKTSTILNKSDVKLSIDQAKPNDQPKYTYEGAIEDYRSRIKLKINVDDKFLQKQDIRPKILYKRKEMFEVDKPLEIHHYESSTSRRLSEDFANSQSIKERLKSLEKCSEQSLKSIEKNSSQINSVKSRIASLKKQSESDTENNNSSAINSKINNKEQCSPKSISSYLNENSSHKNTEWQVKDEISDRCSSPEAEIYMNKLNMFNRDLDAFLQKSHSLHSETENECENFNYPASNLSADIGLSSDREDSGIHTADVSCSVSQADEPVDDTDLSSTTIPNCIEKLNKEKELHQITQKKVDDEHTNFDTKTLIGETKEFLDSVRQQADLDSAEEKPKVPSKPTPSVQNENSTNMSFTDVISMSTSEYPVNKTVNYENVEIKNIFGDNTFPLAPPKTIEPPKEKPPPPPPPSYNENDLENNEDNFKRLNSTKRIKKQIHIKRSSFLGLDEPSDEQFDPDIILDKPPDISSFLQKESQLEKSFYKKLHGSRDMCFSEVESQDSGLESERGRLSSDTWCSSVGDLSTPIHGRQDSEQTNSEDEITKKEREIIELVEKEEKSRDIVDYPNCKNSESNCTYSNISFNPAQKSNRSYLHQPNVDYSCSFNDQDSEVLKVEHELLQLEREEMERRRDNIAFRENHAKMYLQNNRHSFENICDSVNIYSDRSENVNYRKSLPDLQKDYHKSVTDDDSYYRSVLDVQLQSHKSMPNIQQLYQKTPPERRQFSSSTQNEKRVLASHRKSMPELQYDKGIPVYPQSHLINRQPIIAGKPLKLPNKEQRDKGRYMMINPVDVDNFQHIKPGRHITRPGIHALSAIPKSRPLSGDNWIQPKSNLENKSKSYDQHWLYQEAELRRLEDQQRNASPKKNWPQKKHIPEPIIETLTQRVRRPNQPKEYVQHTYMNHPHTMGHASPLSYPLPTALEDSQGVMLSVSGKKKCSYCNNELGRGAAMIIESLCLFYHMECFKCCVCHTQLGDGLMGTDVRVRNQKLHCHNCYSSDDGIKFSCV